MGAPFLLEPHNWTMGGPLLGPCWAALVGHCWATGAPALGHCWILGPLLATGAPPLDNGNKGHNNGPHHGRRVLDHYWALCWGPFLLDCSCFWASLGLLWATVGPLPDLWVIVG